MVYSTLPTMQIASPKTSLTHVALHHMYLHAWLIAHELQTSAHMCLQVRVALAILQKHFHHGSQLHDSSMVQCCCAILQ